MMRSFIKPGGRLPTSRSQCTKRPGEFTKLTDRGREIALGELAAVLHLDMPMMRAITASATFPPEIGRRAAEGVWLLADVIRWLSDNGWRQDAERLAEW